MNHNEDFNDIAERIGHNLFCVQMTYDTLMDLHDENHDAAVARIEDALNEGDCTCYCEDDEHSIGFTQGTDIAAHREQATRRGSASDWARAFVTATTLNERGDTITQYTNWRAVLDPSCLTRYATCNEVDLTIVADDAHHGPGQCGTDCHEAGSASNLCCMSVPASTQREMTDAARTALAEQGFRIDGPWIGGPGGTLTARLAPVILDPNCAAEGGGPAVEVDDPFEAMDQTGRGVAW